MSYSRSSFKSSSSSYRYSREGAAEESSYSRTSSLRGSSRYSSESAAAAELSSYSSRRISGSGQDSTDSTSSYRRSVLDSGSYRRSSARSALDEDHRRLAYRVDEPEDEFQVSLYRMSSRDDDFPSVFRRHSRDEDFPSAFHREESRRSSTESLSRQTSRTSAAALTSLIAAEEEEPVHAEGQVYEAILDYTPAESDKDGMAVKEGQRVDVVDSSSSRRWRVRSRDGDVQEGYVPACYLERVPSQNMDPVYIEAKEKREAIVRELIETEADFARDMQYVVGNYLLEAGGSTMPKELRDQRDALFGNFKAICDFHNNVLIKGVQYYGAEPAKLGKTFLRLERDFDMHTRYCRDEPLAQEVLAVGPLKEYYDALSKMLHDDKSLSEHLKLPIQRINDYQLLFKELVKYSARMKEDTADLEKALDFMKAIPQRMTDLEYINSIQGYTGNLHKLGRIIKHDWFEVIEPNQPVRERHVFLFKGRLFVTDQRRITADKSAYIVKNIIKIQEAQITEADQNKIEIKQDGPGFPVILRASTSVQRNDWLQEMSTPQTYEDLGEDEPKLTEDEELEEMNTAVTESLRSASITSLEDFQSAMEDETSLCLTAPDVVLGVPVAPVFVRELASLAVPAGSTAILECEVAGNPQPAVTWRRGDRVIDVSDRLELYDEGDKHQLLVRCLGAADGGEYTAEAVNSAGRAASSAVLTVTEKPSRPTKPTFREKLRDAAIAKGASVKYTVVVDGVPPPTVTFYHEDREIADDTQGLRVRVPHQDTYVLEVDSFDLSLSGQYSAVAVNSEGRDVCSAAFTPSAALLKADHPVLRVLESNSPDISWGDQDIDGPEFESDSKRFKVALNDDADTVSLLFRNVTPDGSGLYTCVACTSGSKISCSAELTVQGDWHAAC